MRVCVAGASRPTEGGHTAREVDHHARPLAARWRGWNEASAGGTNRRDFLIEGTSRRDFSKRTSRRDFLNGLFKRVKIFSKRRGLGFEQ